MPFRKTTFTRLANTGALAALLGFSLARLLAQNPSSPAVPLPSSPTTSPAATSAPAASFSSQPATSPHSAAATKPAKPKIDEAFTLAFLQQYHPELYKGALLLKEKDPKNYADLFKDLMNEVRGLVDLQRKDPLMFDLTLQDRRLAYKALQLSKQLRDPALKPEDKDPLQAQLTQVVTEQFEVREKMRAEDLASKEKRVADLQKKLEEQRAQLEEREKNKDTLISQRVADLLKKTPRVEW